MRYVSARRRGRAVLPAAPAGGRTAAGERGSRAEEATFCAGARVALESLGFFRADVAQLAEHITRNDGVLGSIPSVGSKKFPQMATFRGGIFVSSLAVC